MAPSEAAPKLFAHEIIAFNDAELDRYLEENREDSGDIHVHVQDWQNITSEFIQRLRDRAGPAKSCPADLDQVAVRLAQLPADSEAIPRPSSPAASAISASSTTTDRTVPGPPKLTAEEEYNMRLKFATESYHALINDGGRPLFPLELLEDVSKNVEKYRESLALPAWQATHAFPPRDHDWMVFVRQNLRWENFRALQRYVRQHKVEWIGLLFFASQHRPMKWEDYANSDLWIKKPKRPANYNEDYDESYMKPGDEGFPEYLEDMKKRLAKYGFTQTFELDKDPARQDKLTTWIEYWNYECWWHDRAANYIKSNKRRYEREWKKLVDSKLLQPFELENLGGKNPWPSEYSVRHYRERVEAERDVNSAKSAMITIQNALRNPRRSGLSPQALQGKLSEAQSKLDATIAKHETIKKRNSLVTLFIHRTSEYWEVQRDAERHSVVVQWALQQVPLIELELNTSNAIENCPGKDRRSRKRRRSNLDEEQDMISTSKRSHREMCDSYDASTEKQSPKRTRYNSEDTIRSNQKPSNSTYATSSVGASGASKVTTAQAAGEERKRRKRASKYNLQPLSVPKLRRSTRIADLEKRRAAIAAPFDIAKTAPKAARTSRRKVIGAIHRRHYKSR